MTDVKNPGFGELAKELADFIRGALRQHTYVGDKEQARLNEMRKALEAAHELRWRHVDDELPPLKKWVACSGYHNVKVENENGVHYARHSWSTHGERIPSHGGAWRWEFDDEDFDGKGMEFWAYELETPEPRHFKLRPPVPKPPPSQETAP